jgi:hypothetical protein
MQILTTSQASPAYSHNPHHNNFPLDRFLLILRIIGLFPGLDIPVQRGFGDLVRLAHLWQESSLNNQGF